MRAKKARWVFPIILILFIVISLSTDQREAWAEDSQLLNEVPDFTLSDIYGDAFTLSDFKGKVILVDFWATWCSICRASIPVLKSLYKDYKGKGLEIVGVALEYDAGRALKRFAEDNKITYTVLIGNGGLASEYGAFGVPTRFLINRQGKIVKMFIGFQDRETLETAIQELL